MLVTTSDQLKKITKSGEICKSALKKGLSFIKPGISTFELNKVVADYIKSQGAKAAFYGYNAGEGPYPFETCICLNHQLVHAIPSKKVIIKSGDLVTIDVGVIYEGHYTDSAYTVEVNSANEDYFLNTGKRSLKAAIKNAVVGKKIGDISSAMQKEVEASGFTVSLDLVGHGVGKALHEPPQIPCFGKKNTGQLLKEGEVLAIEVMYMKGKPALVLGEDGFSFDTKDKSLSAQFEHTIIVRDKKPQIIV